MPQPLRTFIAIEIPAAVRAAAGRLVERLSGASTVVRWVAAENLHLTLKFLGDTFPRQVPEICAALERAVRPLPAFEIELGGAGAFPDPLRPHTVWLGLTEGGEPMRELHAVAEAALERFGFRREHRRFTPHLTLGRVKASSGVEPLGDQIARHAEFPAGRCWVREIVLMDSQLQPQGPAYTVLARAPLRG